MEFFNFLMNLDDSTQKEILFHLWDISFILICVDVFLLCFMLLINAIEKQESLTYEEYKKLFSR